MATTADIERWLEWAGQRLIAMPGPRVGPSEATGWWPDFNQDRFELLAFRGRIALRVAAPGPTEVGLMDEILLLPNLIDGTNETVMWLQRKIVRQRTLLHPITDRHLFSWDRIADRHHSSPYKVQRHYRLGLLGIQRRIQADVASRIGQRFESTLTDRPFDMALSGRTLQTA